MKRYLVTSAILTGLCLVFCLPGLAFFAGLLTFGVAVPLLTILLNLTILLVAGLPAVLAWPQSRPVRILGCAATAGAIFTAFALPGLLARHQVAADAIADVAPVPGSLRRTEGIDILRPSGPTMIRLAEDKHGDGLCDALCRGLLAGGGTPWVRVTETWGIDESGSTTATFRLGDPQSCAAFGAKPPRTEPCILYAPDPGLAAELRLAIAEDPTEDRTTGLRLARRLHRETALAMHGDTVLLRRDHSAYGAATGLWTFQIGTPFYTASGAGITPVYRVIRSPAPDIAADIATLGLPLPTPSGRPLPLSHWSARIASALTQPDPTAPALVADMGSWVLELSSLRTLSPATASLFCRVAALGVLPDTTLDPTATRHGLTCD